MPREWDVLSLARTTWTESSWGSPTGKKLKSREFSTLSFLGDCHLWRVDTQNIVTLFWFLLRFRNQYLLPVRISHTHFKLLEDEVGGLQGQHHQHPRWRISATTGHSHPHRRRMVVGCTWNFHKCWRVDKVVQWYPLHVSMLRKWFRLLIYKYSREKLMVCEEYVI